MGSIVNRDRRLANVAVPDAFRPELSSDGQPVLPSAGIILSVTASTAWPRPSCVRMGFCNTGLARSHPVFPYLVAVKWRYPQSTLHRVVRFIRDRHTPSFIPVFSRPLARLASKRKLNLPPPGAHPSKSSSQSSAIVQSLMPLHHERCLRNYPPRGKHHL